MRATNCRREWSGVYAAPLLYTECCAQSPIGRRPVVIMDVSLPVSVDHTSIPASRECGGMAEVVFRDVQLVGVELRVVTQHAPRQSPVFVADTEEAPKRHDRIRDLSGQLIDHDMFDRTEFRSIGTPNRRTFDFVARNQAGSFASSDFGSHSSCHLHLLLSNADTRITTGRDDTYPQNFRPIRIRIKNQSSEGPSTLG